MKLFEVLIPCGFFSVEHHQRWDEKVIAIAGGLSIMPTLHGKWHGSPELIVTEKMIPVRIATSDEQMHEIVKMTAKHYRQEAVMYYVVSPEVHIVSVA